MNTATYALPVTSGLQVHEDWPLAWLGDYDDPQSEEAAVREFTVLDAMAASGDFFITLATRLDKLAQGLPMDSAEQIEIEHLVKMLFYMQDHYGLTARSGRRGRTS